MKSEFFQQLAPFLKESGLDMNITLRHQGEDTITVSVQLRLPGDLKSTISLQPMSGVGTATSLDEVFITELVKSLNRQQDVFAQITGFEKANAQALETAKAKVAAKPAATSKTAVATPAKPEVKKVAMAATMNLFSAMEKSQQQEKQAEATEMVEVAAESEEADDEVPGFGEEEEDQ